jgi:formate-dependent nitrite reductase membrane component NrfD
VVATRRHDPNPVLSILVVMFFIGLSVGAVKLTSYLQRAEKNKGHITPRNMPMKVIAIQ